MYTLFSQNGRQKPLIYARFKAAFWLALSFILFPLTGYGQAECASINVKIDNIGNNTGVIACAIFESPEGFPDKFLEFASKIMITQIRGKVASFKFADIKPGKYAIAVIHDENFNGKLDKNWLGIPREGYAFSNDAKAVLSAPSFSDAEFLYDGGDLQMSIKLKY